MSEFPRAAHIHTLHRYYLWSTILKSRFEEELQGFTARGESFSFETNEGIVAFAYQSYWYAALYVVVEAWMELELRDERVNELLSSDHVDLLRRYRNGVFHFQPDYFSNRLTPFISDPDSVAWIHELSSELGRWFLAWFDEKRGARG